MENKNVIKRDKDKKKMQDPLNIKFSDTKYEIAI